MWGFSGSRRRDLNFKCQAWLCHQALYPIASLQWVPLGGWHQCSCPLLQPNLPHPASVVHHHSHKPSLCNLQTTSCSAGTATPPRLPTWGWPPWSASATSRWKVRRGGLRCVWHGFNYVRHAPRLARCVWGQWLGAGGASRASRLTCKLTCPPSWRAGLRGAFAWAAPEVLTGEQRCSERADIYSLGELSCAALRCAGLVGRRLLGV